MKQEQFVAKECIVSTLQGKLRGYTVGGVSAFLGVPYAKANRFHPPQSPDGWEGVRDALSYGYACPTPAKGRPSDETLMPLRFWPTDEHCQYLNVWTPNVEGKRPVMFWIHGGAYAAGSSMEHMYYDPRNLCAQGDVVVVSVNHRLNILGYLDLSPFGSEYENSANAGNADLVAALRWVRDNIAAFGGDPECVTLFGQSGGGMKISDIMQTPAADHLYHRAVIQSGILPMLLPPRKGDGTSIVTAMMRELGLENVGQLEEIPYEILLAGYQRTAPALAKEGWYTGGVPMANSWFQGDPLEHGFTEYSKTVPTMVGTTFGEFTYTLADPKKYKKTEQELLYGLREKFGNATEQAVERFRAVWPGRNINDLMAEDAMCRLPTIQYIQEKARVSSAPVYSYLFAYEALLEAVFRLGIAWKSPLCSAILIMWLVAWRGRSPKSWRIKFPRLGSALRKMDLHSMKACLFGNPVRPKQKQPWCLTGCARPGKISITLFWRIFSKWRLSLFRRWGKGGQRPFPDGR